MPPFILTPTRMNACGLVGTIDCLHPFDAFKSLRSLELRDNYLSGSLSSIGQRRLVSSASSQIQTLDLRGNKLSGTIPIGLPDVIPNVQRYSNSTSQETFSKTPLESKRVSIYLALSVFRLLLSKNRLQGPLPTALYRLRELLELVLRPVRVRGHGLRAHRVHCGGGP